MNFIGCLLHMRYVIAIKQPQNLCKAVRLHMLDNYESNTQVQPHFKGGDLTALHVRHLKL